MKEPEARLTLIDCDCAPAGCWMSMYDRRIAQCLRNARNYSDVQWRKYEEADIATVAPAAYADALMNAERAYGGMRQAEEAALSVLRRRADIAMAHGRPSEIIDALAMPKATAQYRTTKRADLLTLEEVAE